VRKGLSSEKSMASSCCSSVGVSQEWLLQERFTLWNSSGTIPIKALIFRTRLGMERDKFRYKNIFNAINVIYKNEGILKFYDGVTITILVPFVYLAYDIGSHSLSRHRLLYLYQT